MGYILPSLVFRFGLMTIGFDYLMQRGGVWYYYRRTPDNVLPLVRREFYRQ